MGSSWKLGRQVCDAVEVTRALESLLSGWSSPVRGCPHEGRGWEPGLWPAQLGIAACLFHKHLRSQNDGGSKFRLLGRCLGKKTNPEVSQEQDPSPKCCLSPPLFWPWLSLCLGCVGRLEMG